MLSYSSAMRYFSIILFACILFSCSHDYKNPHVEIQTSLGDIEVELYPDQAPVSVNAFLGYVDAGYYTNTSFYRVLNTNNQPSYAPKAEVIQGGLYRKKNNIADTLKGIPHENTRQTGLIHTDGVISLARQDTGTANSEFFICIGDQPGFDYGGENNPDGQGFAAFGKVVNGMNIVRKIYRQPDYNQYFDPPVPIYNIKRLH